MRIALSALQQRHFLTGTGRYTSELFRRLPLLAPGAEFILYVKPNQKHLFPHEPENSNLVILKDCPSSPYGRVFWEYLRFPSVLAKGGVDLYHGPTNFLPPRKPCPFVVTLHDMFFFRNPDRTFLLRSLYWRHYIRTTWKLADLILTVSEFSKREIMRYLPVPEEKIRVIYNGVNDRFFQNTPDILRREVRIEYGLDRPYILFFGRLDPDKNPEGLIRAFAMLAQSGKAGDCILAIAGIEDFHSERLPRIAKECLVDDRVRFLGYIKEEHLVPLYQEAKVLCYPSFNEGFGLPPLEAMAAGTPVVTSNISSLPEVVGDAGIQVDPSSPRDIARGLEEALDPVRASELREAGRERAKTFTWDKTTQLTLQAYRDVLGNVM